MGYICIMEKKKKKATTKKQECEFCERPLSQDLLKTGIVYKL